MEIIQNFHFGEWPRPKKYRNKDGDPSKAINILIIFMNLYCDDLVNLFIFSWVFKWEINKKNEEKLKKQQKLKTESKCILEAWKN